MSHPAFNKRDRVQYPRVAAAVSLSLILLMGQSVPLLANPTGGAVVAGAATIGGAGKTLTINQSTNNAIINWQTFSIAAGETTKFIVPSSSSATLNYVLSGNPSAIYGTLSSNGQLYLINPSGILVGAGGRIDTAGFLGSTLNVNNSEFMAGGNLHFTGNSTAGIDNQGSISASTGNVYLIANQVSNEGSLSAPEGNVGLAAGSSVLLQQAGDQHLFVQSNPVGTARAVGVSNAGTIQAASAELRAAGGNAYALAINNTGSIAATGYKKINGQIYLTADTGAITNSGSIKATGTKKGGKVSLASQTGTITNSGTIDASATAAGGQGGSISLKSTAGTTVQSGAIIARGGKGGAGGTAEVSGQVVHFTGTVDMTAAGGKTGSLLLDPATLEIVTGGTGTITGGENDNNSTLDPATVEAALNGADLILNADTNITVTDGITWTSANTLTLSTNTAGSTININAPITGTRGALDINTEAPTDQITTGANGSVDVNGFVLENGSWNQNMSTLPAFTASQDFELLNQSTFLRVTGGDGSTGNPYEITDVYGLQGLATPGLLTASAKLMNNIDASGTASWNANAGFIPIGTYDFTDSSDANTYSGTFDGQNFTINGLTVNAPDSSSVGLFGDTSVTSILKNINLTNVNVSGDQYVGGLVGVNNALVSNCTSSGTVTGDTFVGGLTGITASSISGSSSAGPLMATKPARTSAVSSAMSKTPIWGRA